MYFVHFLNKKLYMDTTRCLLCLVKLLLKSTFEIFTYFVNIFTKLIFFLKQVSFIQANYIHCRKTLLSLRQC